MQYTYKSHPKLYNTWHQMKRRCYHPVKLKECPTYEGCMIDVRWMDFQQFCIDYTNMVGYGNDTHQLDKDILFKGNKIYGPDTCILVPQAINKLILNNRASRGALPVGVAYVKSCNKYRSHYTNNGKLIHLGYFATPEEAFNAYKNAKEQHIKDTANLYKHELDYRAYDALMNWQISEDD